MRNARKQWPTAEQVIEAWESCNRNAEAASRVLNVSGSYICTTLRKAGLEPSTDKSRARINNNRTAVPEPTVTGGRVVMGKQQSGSR